MNGSGGLRITEIAWAAGFFDGEGYVGFVTQSRRPRERREYSSFRLNVAQVHREPLDRFKAAIGLGTVRGPYGPYQGNRKPHYQYRVSGQDAIKAFELLQTFLCGVKREEGLRALKELEKYQSRPKLVNQYGGRAA